MMFKTLALLGLLGNAAAAHSHLRAEDTSAAADESSMVEHLDLVLEIDGERQLFPLLPGVKCPTGHVCHVRTATPGVTGSISPMMSALKNNMKTSLSATLDWQEFNKEMTTVVSSNDYCTRRNAMAKAAGLAAGLSLAAVSQPAYAASTAEVKMGSDSGQLVFVPNKISICKGDTIKWTNNKGGPHNVVFDEDAIPAGVDQEKISMDEQLGEEGDTYSVALDTAGEYEYYCEPHRGAGMVAKVTVA